MKNDQVKPDWCIAAIEETRDWNEAFVARAGRIFGLHLYDANRHVHCCELTPSYELHLFDTVCTNPCDEDLYDTLMEGQASSDDVSYYHVNAIERMPDNMIEKLDMSYDPDNTWEQERDDVLEYLQGNYGCPPGVPFVFATEEAPL